MYYVYVLQHLPTKKIYFGYTNNLKRRLEEHNAGGNTSTKRSSGEWILVYAEIYRSKLDALKREKLLKQHGSNKRWLKSRITHSMF